LQTCILATCILATCILATFLLSGCTRNPADGPITATGFIEGETVQLAPEVGGRIVELTVREGDAVTAGQVLARLDNALLQTQRAQAEAAVAAAQANLERVRAGARPAEQEAARAALAQAEAQRDGAQRALVDAEAALENPQELNAQIAAARTQVALAEQQLAVAQLDLSDAQFRHDVLADQGGDTERALAFQVEAAREAVNAAQAQLDGARRYLNALTAIRAHPLTLQAQLHAAQAQARASEAAVAAAQAQLDELEAGPTAEEVALAQAQLHQAQAALALADVQMDQLTLTAPITGMVASRSAHVGETAAPRLTLLTLTNLDQVTLVLYIPETQIGRVRVGQPVEVRVDSFPGRVFLGQVTAIAGEAEFTPRNVQTQEERVNLVFAVRVTLPNHDHALKPGMPADAVIQP